MYIDTILAKMGVKSHELKATAKARKRKVAFDEARERGGRSGNPAAATGAAAARSHAKPHVRPHAKLRKGGEGLQRGKDKRPVVISHRTRGGPPA